LGQAGQQQPGVDVAEQHRVMQPGLGQAVAVTVRDADDQPVDAQPAQVIAHLAGGDRVSTEQSGEQGAQVAVGEPVRVQPEHQQGLEQGVGAAIAQA
jgi:hypothetical protein